LNVPKARQGFEAKIDDAKDVTFSPNLAQPANQRYRQWMEKTVKDMGLPQR
jgi:hypothetical protein